MNLRLARVFMRGVGPLSARYDPLLVDFRNETTEADHAVLWLRNGGGKTTFERLVFHVVAWSDARNIGKQDAARPGGIEYLLGPEDVGHIVLEWIRADAPDALSLITGLICQLKQGTGHRRDDDGNLKRTRADVERRFYCFHAQPGVGLEDVVEAQLSDGRRLSLSGYAKVLDNLNTTHSRLRLEATTSVNEWTAMLEDRGLDAELFRYQVHMNQGEGGADQVIARAATNEQFIDFVLRAVTPPRDVADVREQFERYREELAQMPIMRRRRAFVATLRDSMSALASAHDGEQRAAQSVRDADQEARALHGRFLAAAERSEASAAHAKEEQVRLRRQRTEADTARKRHNEEASWLESWAVEQRIAAVSRELADVQVAWEGAQLDAAAWPLAEAVIGRDTADALAKQLEASLRERDDQTAPLRSERDRYAAALRAAHESAAKQHEEAERAARSDVEKQKELAESLDRDAKDAERRATTAKLHVDKALAQIADAARARASAISNGLLEREVSAVEAQAAASVSADHERARADRSDELAAEQVRLAAAALASRTRAEQDATAASGRRGAAQRDLDSHASEGTEVAALPGLADLIDGAVADLHAAEEVLGPALRDRVSSIEAEQRDTESQLAQTRRDLDALANRKLLAPRAEVARGLGVLGGECVEAISGFAYLDDAAPAAERDRLVAQHPHIADGIVLTAADANVDRALEALNQAGAPPTFPIAVAPAANLLDQGEQVGWQVWGGDKALYDRTAAEARRLTLEQNERRQQERAEELARTAEDGRQAATALTAFRRHWPAERLDALRTDHAAAGEALSAAHQAAGDSDAKLQAAQAAECEARDTAKAARFAATEHQRRALALADAATAELEARDANERAEHQRGLLATAAAEAHSKYAAAAAARERHDGALTAATESRSAAAHSRAAAAAVIRVTTMPEPELAALPATTLAQQLAVAQRQLDTEVADDALSRELDDARRESRRHESHLNSVSTDVTARAVELAEDPSAGTPEGRARQAQAAADAATRHARRRSQLDKEDGALREHRERIGRERTQPADIPDSIERAQQLREEAVAAAGRQRALGEELGLKIQELIATENRADRDSAVFRGLLDPLLEPQTGQAPYDEDTNAATAARDDDRAKRDRLASKHRQRQHAVESGRRAITALLTDPAAESAPDLAEKLRRLSEDLLATNAAHLTAELHSQVALVEERLSGLDSDRELIVKFLEPRVADAIARLRALQRTSRLPASLGAWADREFLAIRFDPPGDTARRHALVGKALDELLQAGGAVDGFRLLLHAVLTVLGRVRVSLLKPEPGLPSAQLIPVSGLSDLSGGERATIAILLYCALTNLRREALARSDRLAAVSTLLLDNPFGKASSGFLVDQQIQMATALGMQLVYATAIEDANALDRFKVFVRLRNRQDLTRSMRYVRHDGQPASLAVNGDAPTIEAARLVRRQTP